LHQQDWYAEALKRVEVPSQFREELLAGSGGKGGPDDLPSLVMHYPNCVGPLGRPIVRPSEMTREDVLGTLMPFETNQRHGCKVRLAGCDEGSV
jgi:hypothetical protein